MNYAPEVSIGIPVYNGQSYLSELLGCLLEQSFQNFEIVISDNASTDRTSEICADYVGRDTRIRYSRNERNIGAAKNFNRVFELTGAPYFKWTAHDDLYEPTYLERCLDAIKHSPEVVLCHSGVRFVDNDGCRLQYDGNRQCYVNDRGGVFLPPNAQWAMETLTPLHLAEGHSPPSRFHDAVHRIASCTQIFGIIRRHALCRSSLIKSYYGSDKAVLAELALMGRFHQVEDQLFAKRCHSEMSFSLSPQQKARWIDPDAHRSLTHLSLFPVRLFFDYMKAVIRADTLSSYQRIVCFGVVASKVVRARLWGRIFRGFTRRVFGTFFKHV